MKRPGEGSLAGPLAILLGSGIVFLLILLGTAGARSARDLAAAKQQETSLEERIEQTESRVETLEQRIVRLRRDPMTLERLAREELGMVREGEVIIVLPQESEPSGSGPGRWESGRP